MRFNLTTAISATLAALVSFSWALDERPGSHYGLESGIDDDNGWFDLSVAVGMKSDESSSSPLQKRSESLLSTPAILKRSPETGKLVWPRSFSEALTVAKRNVPQKLQSSLHRRTALARRAMKVMITWYNGKDLLNPSCFADSDKWAPTDSSMVGAVTIEWPGKPPCGSFVKIQHHSDPHKNIVVRIVDSCGGCERGSPHIDLTVGAFEKLYDQEVGSVEGLKAKVVPCPQKVEQDWSQKVIDTYGPKVPLQNS